MRGQWSTPDNTQIKDQVTVLNIKGGGHRNTNKTYHLSVIKDKGMNFSVGMHRLTWLCYLHVRLMGNADLTKQRGNYKVCSQPRVMPCIASDIAHEAALPSQPPPTHGNASPLSAPPPPRPRNSPRPHNSPSLAVSLAAVGVPPLYQEGWQVVNINDGAQPLTSFQICRSLHPNSENGPHHPTWLVKIDTFLKWYSWIHSSLPSDMLSILSLYSLHDPTLRKHISINHIRIPRHQRTGLLNEWVSVANSYPSC